LFCRLPVSPSRRLRRRADGKTVRPTGQHRRIETPATAGEDGQNRLSHQIVVPSEEIRAK